MPLFKRPYLLFYRLVVFCFLIGSLRTYAQQEQSYERFQYHKFHWKEFNTKVFNIYFPAGLDSVCSAIAKELPTVIAQVKKSLLIDNIKAPNIIIYPSPDQLYESNIGSYESQQYTFPSFVYKARRILITYNGSYDNLKTQLYEAIVRSQWETQIRPDAIEAQIKGGKNELAPMWFKEGAIRYFAHGWTIEAEDKFHLSFQQNSFSNWLQVLQYEPRLAGQAFCYYLSEHYQPKVVAQIFFQLKKGKSLIRSIRLITKHDLDTLFVQCYNFYNDRYKQADILNVQAKNIIILHKKGIVKEILFSPNEQYISYTTTFNGKRAVYAYDLKNKTTRKITTYQLPPWIDEHSADQYPLLQWGKNTNDLFVALPEKGKISIKRYSAQGSLQEKMKLAGIDGITSVTPLSDREFLLAAYRKGQSDIVNYNYNKLKYTPYTDDVYDDENPVMNEKGELFFVSNRPKELKQKVFKIGFGYDPDTLWQGIYTIRGKEIVPLTIDTVWYKKWDKPNMLPDGKILATHTMYGAERFAILNPPTTLAGYQTYQYTPKSEYITFYKTSRDSIYIAQQPINDWISQNKATLLNTTGPWLIDYRQRQMKQAEEDSILRAARDTTHSILEDIFGTKTVNKNTAHINDSTAGSLVYNAKKIKPYIIQLHSAYFTAKVNNDYFINRYQPYLNYQGQFKFPELGGMAQGGFTDMFENHHFTIAYRIPAGTEGSDFFVRYENTEKKLDWGLSYFRKAEMLQPDQNRNWVDESGKSYPNSAKVKTHYYELFLHYPLTYYSSVAFQTAVRKDRTIFLATDKYSLEFDPIESLWSINTLSYKLNKLRPTIPLLYKGFKAETFIDVFKGFTQEQSTVLDTKINFSYHQPLYKYITLVTQGHIGYSGGDKKILYNLGGLDNNVTVKVDTTKHFSQSAPYAFQTLVTPFRGYYQNTLYGNEYALLNADVYFPLFQTLIPLQTPLPAINNLQLGLFTDAGTTTETWNSANPNNGNWLQSFGLSARTTLAGYPIRIDVAWPGNINKQPVWYFSLNLH